MISGKTQAVTAPVKIAEATGELPTHVVVRWDGGSGNAWVSGTEADVTGDIGFVLPSDGTPVPFVMLEGEQLWANSDSSVDVACLVGNQ
jgi:hypothetical protein